MTELVDLLHGDRPSNVRCAFQDCGAKPSKADIQRVRLDVARHGALQRMIVSAVTGEREPRPRLTDGQVSTVARG